MSATREHDEAILSALRLMGTGLNLSSTARCLGKNPSNLGKSMREVLRHDLECGDDPYDVAAAYPSSIIIGR